MRNKRFMAAGAAMVLLAAVSACSSDDDGGDDSPSPSAASESSEPMTEPTDSTGATDTTDAPQASIDPTRGITIVQAGPPPASWDPATTSAQITQLVKAYNAVYDTLLRVDGNDELTPLLATDWEYDSTNTVLTLTLRDDVTFSDGATFDADVAKLNLERVKAGTSQGARLLAPIASIEVTSPTELVITQTAPNSKVLSALASPAASMASPLVIESNPDSLAQTPVGSGPFTVESQDATTVVLVRNDNYWDTETVFPATLTYTGAVDPNARVNAILTGAVDVAYLSQDVPPPDLLAAVDAGDLTMVEVPAVPGMIGINSAIPPLDNEKVREAINLAIDRNAINEVLNEGRCEPASQLFVPGQPGYIEDLSYEYDPDRARELMEEAGVGPVTIQFQSVAGSSTAAVELYASMLGEIGITLEVAQSQIQEVFPNFFGGEYAMSVLQLFLSMPDAAFVTDYFTGPFNPGEKPAELVEMVNEAVALPTDDPDRDEAFEEINQYVFDHSMVVPLCYQTRTLVGDPDVVGLDDIPMVAIGHTDMSRLGMQAES